MSGVPGDTFSRDIEHLKLLVIFHYIVGAVTAAWSSIALIHFFIGLALLLAPHMAGPDRDQALAVRFVGAAFAGIGAFVVLVGWTVGGLTAYAGRCISQRKAYIFCLVVSCINCLQMPLGTALGVFTLIVLFRDSVKGMFKGGPPAQTSARSAE